MSRNPISNLIYTTIAWTPIIALIVGVFWVLSLGAMHLEMITHGSEIFVSNAETANTPSWRMGGSNNEQANVASQLSDALNSGDVQVMSEALDRLERQQG